MQYVGIRSQQVRNNARSLLLLCCFPLIISALVWLFCYIMALLSDGSGSSYVDDAYNYVDGAYYYVDPLVEATDNTLTALPWVGVVVLLWFAIAYYANTAMVRHATSARPLERRENPRVYNIVENLTMACGMPMPKVNVINSRTLNAFASGVDTSSYTVTVTTGICDCLDDDELAGVIGHELTHIRNRDTRLLIISIVFVGIMSTVMTLAWKVAWRLLFHGGGNSRSKNGKGGVAVFVILLIAAALAAVGYVFTLMTRFAISRKREFMADAGGAELCGNPLALASALRKISANPTPAPEGRDDVAQLYIIHSSFAEGVKSLFANAFATHPDTEERIRILEQF